MSRFDEVRMTCPKAKEQYITPKLAYLSRFGDCIVVKIARTQILLVFEGGDSIIIESGVYHKLRNLACKEGSSGEVSIKKLLPQVGVS